jgi:hypothetical protein
VQSSSELKQLRRTMTKTSSFIAGSLAEPSAPAGATAGPKTASAGGSGTRADTPHTSSTDVGRKGLAGGVVVPAPPGMGMGSGPGVKDPSASVPGTSGAARLSAAVLDADGNAVPSSAAPPPVAKRNGKRSKAKPNAPSPTARDASVGDGLAAAVSDGSSGAGGSGGGGGIGGSGGGGGIDGHGHGSNGVTVGRRSDGSCDVTAAAAASARAAQVDFSLGPPTKTGFLKKRSGGNKRSAKWDKRWCELSDTGFIHYYKKQGGKNAGSVYLKGGWVPVCVRACDRFTSETRMVDMAALLTSTGNPRVLSGACRWLPHRACVVYGGLWWPMVA